MQSRDTNSQSAAQDTREGGGIRKGPWVAILAAAGVGRAEHCVQGRWV